MNISGFELNQSVDSVFCRNGYCSEIIPLCFAGVSPNCARNRSALGWYHVSFGEHICLVCYRFLDSKLNSSNADSVWRHRLSAWRREWMRKSSISGRKLHLSTADFLVAQLLPWWVKCRICDQWRQLPPRMAVGAQNSPFYPQNFICSMHSKLIDNPCSWPVDERTTLVLHKPQDFLASMQTHAWLQAPPCFNLLSSSYGIDLTGLSADILPGQSEKETASEVSINFDGLSSFSPIDLQPWERTNFPEMARFPTLYLSVRNLIICLWYSNPKNFLTIREVANRCFVRGLLRIVLCEHWIPRLISEFTRRGLINVGICQLPRKIVGANRMMDRIENGTVSPETTVIRLVGHMNLENAMTTRQIANGLLLNRLSNALLTKSEQIPAEITVHFQPVSFTQPFGDPFGEVLLKWSACGECRMNNSDEVINQTSELEVNICTVVNPLDIPQTNESTQQQLVLPAHSWSDRLYCDNTNLATILAQQTCLETRPLSDCLLIDRTVDENGSASLVRIGKDQRVRIEFHVEAVLDMVAQLCGSHAVPDDAKNLITVQESWDKFDVAVRARLNDLGSNVKLEQKLIEFFLAQVESDLTEPLTGNNRDIHSWPTARLDRLPAQSYVEFLIDSTQSGQHKNGHSISWCPCVLTVNSEDRDRRLFARLCSSLLTTNYQTDTIQAIHIRPVTEKLAVEESIESQLVASTPRPDEFSAHVPLTNESTSVCMSATEIGTFNVYVQYNDRVEVANWLAVNLTPDEIQFVFTDDSDTICSKPYKLKNKLPIYLPTTLKETLTEEMSADFVIPSADSIEIDQNSARLITVTLVYPTPWWRPILLSRLLESPVPDKMGCENAAAAAADGSGGFALLPSDRKSRGFCHVFRDMTPELPNIGVLQTQLFAVAADDWWSEADATLTTTVDKHVQSYLSHEQSHSLLSSHVGRLQYHPKTNHKNCEAMTVDESGRQLRLKSNFWKCFESQFHIILLKHINIAVPEDMDPNSLDEVTHVHSIGLDALTRTIQSSLNIAELTLRHVDLQITHPTSLNYIGSSLVDSSNTLEEFTVPIDSWCEEEEVDKDSATLVADDNQVISDRAQRMKKRKLVDSSSHIG